MKKLALLNLLAILTLFLTTCMFVSCGKSKKSKPSEEGPDGMAALFPDNPLSRAKFKANRIKCVNNLGSIGKALLGFSQDNGGRTPWNLSPVQQQNHFGDHYKLNVGSIFGVRALMSELQTPKILVSPCDKSRTADNEVLQYNWAGVNTRAGKPVNHAGLSYGLCLGGDFQRAPTVIAMTRNLSVDDLAQADWVGGSDKRRRMSGLKFSQGQLVLSDGSARQSTNADLGANGKIIKWHINSRGGATQEDPSTKVLLPY